jgi:hypothetical protein
MVSRCRWNGPAWDGEVLEVGGREEEDAGADDGNLQLGGD